MTESPFRDAVRMLLHAHSEVQVSPAGHAGYVERYRTSRGANIGLETRGKLHQNLFVEAQHIDLGRLGDIPHRAYIAANYKRSRPNSNLFHAGAFGDVDIVCFKLTELGQAERVLAEVIR